MSRLPTAPVMLANHSFQNANQPRAKPFASGRSAAACQPSRARYEALQTLVHQLVQHREDGHEVALARSVGADEDIERSQGQIHLTNGLEPSDLNAIELLLR